MRKLTTLAFVSIATLALAAPAAATIINVNGQTNASMDGHNAVSQIFDAGTYQVTFTQDEFTAFSRWSSNMGCDKNGANCRQGWENSVVFFLAGNTASPLFLGDGNAHGGVGPLVEGGYFDSAAASFAHSGVYSGSFTLTIPTEVSFFIADNTTTDNRGGVSLSVDRLAVPEPAPWPFLLTGLGVMALMLRLRQRKANF